jgi:hypothetical protein
VVLAELVTFGGQRDDIHHRAIPTVTTAPRAPTRIDVAFDVRDDTPPGKDPDAYSPTLRKYHRWLWNKSLPSGVPFEPVLDAAAASQGVYTAGEFRKDLSEKTAGPFSQDFEQEADYVGMYILARANRPFASAADLWRRMAQASPGSIKFTVSHPTTEERYLRLDEAAAEIQRTQASQSPLLPEKRNKK